RERPARDAAPRRRRGLALRRLLRLLLHLRLGPPRRGDEPVPDRRPVREAPPRLQRLVQRLGAASDALRPRVGPRRLAPRLHADPRDLPEHERSRAAGGRGAARQPRAALRARRAGRGPARGPLRGLRAAADPALPAARPLAAAAGLVGELLPTCARLRAL